jgi:hypothetical protein
MERREMSVVVVKPWMAFQSSCALVFGVVGRQICKEKIIYSRIKGEGGLRFRLRYDRERLRWINGELVAAAVLSTR